MKASRHLRIFFKAMYKTSPAEFRETENFYPLQLEIYLKEELVKMDLTKDNIKFATPEDADDWMELVSLTIDGYPCLDKKITPQTCISILRIKRL